MSAQRAAHRGFSLAFLCLSFPSLFSLLVFLFSLCCLPLFAGADGNEEREYGENESY